MYYLSCGERITVGTTDLCDGAETRHFCTLMVSLNIALNKNFHLKHFIYYTVCCEN
jgi:hypothetical protein